MPERIQRRRVAGWRMPIGAVYVGRPTKWGNEWRVIDPKATGRHTAWVVHREVEPLGASLGTFSDKLTALRVAVMGYWVAKPDGFADVVRDQLAGKDLACWCPLDQPCHADVLLEIANGGQP